MANPLSPAAYKSSAGAVPPKTDSAYPPCVLPANELKPIFISQMELGTHHRGKRTVIHVHNRLEEPTALAAVVEDEEGTPAWLELYHQPVHKDVPVQLTLRRGGCYLIKEPFAIVGTEDCCILRVDHPGDIFHLSFDHEFLPAIWRMNDVFVGKSHEIRMKGNEAVGKMRWAEAEDLYSTAIRVAETADQARLAYLNRSLANLRLKRPVAALEDAIRSAGPDNSASTEKGLFREANALYELAKYDQSLDRLRALKAAYPSNSAAEPIIDRVLARLKEQQTGKYDFLRMYKQAKATPPHIDCATYTMPVEIQDSPGKGRGLFTTRKVLAGDLLICEKAFGYVYGGKDHSSSLGMTQSEVTQGLRTQIVQRLFHNIEDARMFSHLHHGDYEAAGVSEVDGKPVVDSCLVAKVVSLTGFGPPRDSLSRLKEIISGVQNGVQETPMTTGVWTVISHINHSCISNAKNSFIGDMQIVRATRNLDAGTELLISYKGPEDYETYDEAQKRLSGWGFTCDCILCLDRKATPQPEEVLLKRKSLWADFFRYMEIGIKQRNLTKAQRFLDRLDQTYSSAAKKPGAFRLEAWEFCLTLGDMLVCMRNHVEAIEVTLRGLEAIGFVISANPRTGSDVTKSSKAVFRIIQWGLAMPFSISAFRILHLAYKIIAPENAPLARVNMEIAYRIWVGESDTFLDTYPEMA